MIESGNVCFRRLFDTGGKVIKLFDYFIMYIMFYLLNIVLSNNPSIEIGPLFARKHQFYLV